MLIGIDIDEVLSETVDFALAYHKGEIKGKKLERNQISDYWLPNIPGFECLTKEEAAFFLYWSACFSSGLRRTSACGRSLWNIERMEGAGAWILRNHGKRRTYTLIYRRTNWEALSMIIWWNRFLQSLPTRISKIHQRGNLPGKRDQSFCRRQPKLRYWSGETRGKSLFAWEALECKL